MRASESLLAIGFLTPAELVRPSRRISIPTIDISCHQYCQPKRVRSNALKLRQKTATIHVDAVSAESPRSPVAGDSTLSS
jgi:hypothetical protein